MITFSRFTGCRIRALCTPVGNIALALVKSAHSEQEVEYITVKDTIKKLSVSDGILVERSNKNIKMLSEIEKLLVQ